jgi:uncharacterized damage-inducible protein DinB
MGMGEPLAAELKQESATTRRLLERVPEDKFSWKPHEKSMTLGRLASHLAELPALLVNALTADEIDFASGDYKPFAASSVEELLEKFDANISEGVERLKGTADERMFETWRMRRGEQVMFELPRVAVVRGVVLNHVVHHRGQLSVYLRLLDVPLPSIYGPTADAPMF